MDFKIAREALLELTDSVGGVVEKRNTIPILSNIQIVAENGALTVRATDLDILVEKKTTGVDIGTPGNTTVNSDLLQSITAKLPSGAQVHISVSDGRMRIRSGRSDFKLPVLPSEDFPILTSAGHEGNSFEIKASDFAKALKIVEGAMSTEESRYYLNGVYIDPRRQDGDEENDLRFVATDGHRLSLTRVTTDKADVSQDSAAIIPRKAIRELIKALTGGNEMVSVTYGSRNIRATFGDVIFLSKLVDGTYPDYARVIPSASTIKSTFDATSMKQAVERVSVISTERTRALKLMMGRENVEIVVTDPTFGNANEEVSAEGSDEIQIGFNARYFADFLAQEDGNITLHMTEPGAPAKIEFSSRPSDLAVIMPMRI